MKDITSLIRGILELTDFKSLH